MSQIMSMSKSMGTGIGIPVPSFIHPLTKRPIKLGRRHRSRTRSLDALKLVVMHKYLASVPDAPVSVDNSAGITAWGMMENDTLGDCTIAACGHLIQCWTASNGPGSEITVPDSIILGAYEAWDGYVAGNPSTDNGGVPIVVLQDWEQQGQQGLGGYPITAHALLDLTQQRVQQSIYIFGAAYGGVELPITAQSQVGGVWDIVGDGQTGDSAPGSWGGHCLIPGTRLLTSDLQWVPIEKLAPGDGLIGFDEYRVTPRRKYRPSTVLSSEVVSLPCFRVFFDDGTSMTASSGHLWLSNNSSETGVWIATEKMKMGTKVLKPFEVWEEDTSRGAGYLAAAFDGEGWLSTGGSDRGIHKLGFAQRENVMLAQVESELTERGFEYWRGNDSGNGYGKLPCLNLRISGKNNIIRFLGSIRPHRLLTKFETERMGCMYDVKKVEVAEIEPIGETEVVALETDTHTYIAEGFASHNCTAIVGYTAAGLTCVTWGALQQMTWRFFMAYYDECHGVLSPNWKTPYPTSTLESDLAFLSGQQASPLLVSLLPMVVNP
jgi:hypothetical protein